MKNKIFVFFTIAVSLLCILSCSMDPGDSTPRSAPMQVYQTDRTTPYTGEDLDFYIQGDASKTVAATIRNGMLVITYIPLPAGLVMVDVDHEYNPTPGLQRHVITFVSVNDSKLLNYRITPSGAQQVRAHIYNKDGNFSDRDNIYNVKQGWNFVYTVVSLDPEIFTQFVWVVADNN